MGLEDSTNEAPKARSVRGNTEGEQGKEGRRGGARKGQYASRSAKHGEKGIAAVAVTERNASIDLLLAVRD